MSYTTLKLKPQALGNDLLFTLVDALACSVVKAIRPPTKLMENLEQHEKHRVPVSEGINRSLCLNADRHRVLAASTRTRFRAQVDQQIG